MAATLTKATLPFTKKRVGNHYRCAEQLTALLTWCGENDAELFLTDAPYQIAKIIGSDFKIVVYPHKTSAGNIHLRVRDEGSKNKLRAAEVMRSLDDIEAYRYNCTFGRLNA